MRVEQAPHVRVGKIGVGDDAMRKPVAIRLRLNPRGFPFRVFRFGAGLHMHGFDYVLPRGVAQVVVQQVALAVDLLVRPEVRLDRRVHRPRIVGLRDVEHMMVRIHHRQHLAHVETLRCVAVDDQGASGRGGGIGSRRPDACDWYAASTISTARRPSLSVHGAGLLLTMQSMKVFATFW
ncbi:MAG: hypothetical protein IPI73_05515 [Betaproteobacteria bacterium]|nr:hypothetical protein [Betaproteobacteria bacterium]